MSKKEEKVYTEGELETLAKDKMEAEVIGQITGMFQTYRDKIFKTFQASGKSVAISFGVSVEGLGSNQLHIETKISFTESKVSDKIEADVNIAQIGMFEKEEKL